MLLLRLRTPQYMFAIQQSILAAHEISEIRNSGLKHAIAAGLYYHLARGRCTSVYPIVGIDPALLVKTLANVVDHPLAAREDNCD